MTLSCRELLIPIRLRRINRNKINAFNDENEVVYRWFPPDIEYSDDGRLSAATIGRVFSPPFDISCNRSKLCKYSTDVLYNVKKLPHRHDHGVIKANIEKIKAFSISLEVNSMPVSINFDFEHKPEECMYPHTEIVVFKNGEKIEKKLNTKTIKLAIREELSKVFTVCHEPNPNFQLEMDKEKNLLIEKLVELWVKIKSFVLLSAINLLF